MGEESKAPSFKYLAFIAFVVFPLRIMEVIAHVTIKVSIWAEKKAEDIRFK